MIKHNILKHKFSMLHVLFLTTSGRRSPAARGSYFCLQGLKEPNQTEPRDAPDVDRLLLGQKHKNRQNHVFVQKPSR